MILRHGWAFDSVFFDDDDGGQDDSQFVKLSPGPEH